MRQPLDRSKRPARAGRSGTQETALADVERLPKAVRIVRRRLGGRGWEVVRPEAKQPSAITTTQAEAEVRARELLANVGGGQLVVKDGKGATVSTERIEPRPRVR
jgi:hypothetical protein